MSDRDVRTGHGAYVWSERGPFCVPSVESHPQANLWRAACDGCGWASRWGTKRDAERAEVYRARKDAGCFPMEMSGRGWTATVTKGAATVTVDGVGDSDVRIGRAAGDHFASRVELAVWASGAAWAVAHATPVGIATAAQRRGTEPDRAPDGAYRFGKSEPRGEVVQFPGNDE